ncbi:FAD-dependent oxidoreductase [Gracilibacillus phocaeensis]|uniref:FAD-dependent oxidoreductase n=1 Tax=Gracilibacillus phocaeensis TaxID=2042304 RepID=UPI00102F875A|nr:FAD-dependent oxidoreductase [Gracilibacillus phocaeensis]
MKYEIVKKDITVVGGGLAGVCAAVAAARLGKKVALIQNRPVLGGNSSSEVRVWVVGATKHGVNRYARETGIMGEMFVENQYRNPDGNPYMWDLIILEKVKAESNIELFLNTDVREIESSGREDSRTIHSVTGWMMGSERHIRFESPVYLDCTGDGLIGFLARAAYRIGREGKSEYNESWAPDQSDEITLGSTILFYTRDEGHPVKYVAPSFAKDITTTSIPERRIIRSGDSGCHYWWIEWGGELDTVHEDARIRDELWSVIYGIWDYIKNSGKFEAENMTLEWVGAIPGKREYRRFIGDYTLTQNDIVEQVEFADRVAFGGWSIDLHPPGGMYAEASGSKHLQADGIYHIPFRSLYSKNVDNLLFAGRNISASHVAFGSTRVMATCAVIGEAAGTGAAYAVEKRMTPREIHTHHIKELQQTLLKQDASVIGIKNEQTEDLARQAEITASSTCETIQVTHAAETYQLEKDVAFLFPVELQMEGIELKVTAKKSTELTIELWDTGKPQNYIPHHMIDKKTIEVKPGEAEWVAVDIPWHPSERQNAFVIVKENPDVALHRSDQPVTGVLSFEDVGDAKTTGLFENEKSSITKWSMKNCVRKPFCFRVQGKTAAYAPAKVTNGLQRPYRGPNLWKSDVMNKTEEWLTLKWDREVSIRGIHLTWNDDVNEDLINLHHHRTPFDIIPELVKNYEVQVLVDQKWRTVVEVDHNRKRKQVHYLNHTDKTSQCRLVIHETNGSPHAEVVEVRVYG